ncbi:hypothetical protein [Actinoplanes sp. NPDC020271]|uniref:hypothetical protein n=1 Tax=Actinoplanes sp. NPDC020271 TaxID=3363896 RepID=UPI0037AC81FD
MFAVTAGPAQAATGDGARPEAIRDVDRGGSTWTPTKNTTLAQLMVDAVAPSPAAGETGARATFPGAARLLVATGEPAPGRLEAALLTVADLPKGYAPMPDALKAFADTGSRIGACDKKATVPDRAVVSGGPEGPGLPVNPSPRVAVSPPAEASANPPAPLSDEPTTNPMDMPPGKPDPGRATPVAPPPGQPGPASTEPGGNPVKPAAPAGKPAGKPVKAGHEPVKAGNKKDSGTVRVAFMKGETGPVLIEAIDPAGDRAAQAVVDAVADAPRRCPAYDEGTPGTPDALHMATYPLQVPKFGNRTAGVRFEVDLNSPRVTVHGKMIAVSVRGVALTVLLANLEQPDQRELEAITRAAVQKFDRQK